MRIEELQQGQEVSLLVNANGTSLTFTAKILDVYPRRHFLLLSAVYYGEKAVSFRGKGVVVDMLVCGENEKPALFKNITSTLIKKADGTLCYNVTTIAESVVYNRRENFRCYVGLPTSVQFGPNHAAHNAVIKDVSSTGFAIVCDQDIDLDKVHLLHVVLNDNIEETGDSFAFHMYGLVARKQELENGYYVYGCRLNHPIAGLDRYIMLKERLRLRKTHGGALA